jgi:TP901 family phage tail tape measure protein
LQGIKSQLNSLQGKTVTTYVQTKQKGASASAVAKGSGSQFGSDFAGAMGVGTLSAGAVAGAGVAAAGAGVAMAVKKFADFDAVMSKVKALTGATDKEMEKLTATAQKLGAETKFSASEAAEAMTFLGMAGWKTNEIISAMPGLLDLSAASGEDLARVADIVSDDLTAFKMSADQAGHFADVLAVASTNANTNVSMMGETFKYVGPLAGSLGYSIEDMALATGIMANSSIKGEQAGTTLRALLTRLVKPTKESAAAMDRLGISITDSDGKMKSFRQIIADIRKGFTKLTEAEKGEVAAMLAGQEAMSGTLALADAKQEDIDKLTKALDNSSGAAKKMAGTMNDNLKGSLTELGSAMESVALKAGKVFEPAIRKAVKKSQKWFSDLSKTLSDYEIIINARAQAKSDGMTTEELDEYRRENNIAELESQHSSFTGLLDVWDGIAAGIETATGRIYDIFAPALTFISDMFSQDLLGEWQLFQELVEGGLKDLGEAFQNLQPFIEAITPLLQVIIELVGTVLVWAFKTALLMGAGAFRIIAGLIEAASEVARDFGNAVKWVANELEYLIGLAMKAFEWLGLIESKSAGLNATAVNSMFGGRLKGGDTNTQNINVGSINVPTASDVGAGIGSLATTPTYFPYE